MLNLNLFQKNKKNMLDSAKDMMDLTAQISRREQKDIERLFARLFSTEDGEKVLAYLHHTTFQRAFGSNAAEEQLRFSEGQRALVATILRLIDRGRQG